MEDVNFVFPQAGSGLVDAVDDSSLTETLAGLVLPSATVNDLKGKTKL